MEVKMLKKKVGRPRKSKASNIRPDNAGSARRPNRASLGRSKVDIGLVPRKKIYAKVQCSKCGKKLYSNSLSRHYLSKHCLAKLESLFKP